MSIKVLVAEDDPEVRAGLVRILAADPDLAPASTAADGEAAVTAALAQRPDVVLMDIRMPRLDGLAAAERMLARPGAPAVVMLTTFGEQAYVDRAIAAGVSGFLLKTGDPAALLHAVHVAAAGGACLDPGIARTLLAELRTDRAGRNRAAAVTGGLTGRERDVLMLLAQGLSNAEIGRELNLVEGTVKGYVSSVLTRLGVRNRVEAAIIGHRLEQRSAEPG